LALLYVDEMQMEHVMKKSCFLICALATGPAFADNTPTLTGQEFMMPSRNVACIKLDAIDDGDVKVSDRLYCLRYEPKLIAVILDDSGAHAGPTEGDQPFSNETPILQYGETWYKEGFKCTAKAAGVECSHNKYGAFRLSRKGFKKLR
jgi:hypothetical protein